ncbi:MAG: GntR family transcriptional regulator [Lachnospiraceae bacterium]|nr:GntR family transcriptional regulator [Lachnospiraceae bacterium]MBR6350428.1 GntR family transcriptional regulator [Lachnospiraceae bacterium]
MTNLKMNFDEYIPLRDLVFKTLREAIITGDLKPGERLMEIKLANELGVSRTPVREAIRKLELEGLVIMTARKGAEVAPINEKDLREVLEIRKALESLACQLACRNADDESIEKLRLANKEVINAVKDNNVELITQTDVEFHEVIYEITRNQRLIQMLHQLKEHIFRYRLEYIKEMKNRNSIVDEHNRIIEAIVDGSVRNAKREIERHIEVQEKYILNTLSGEK